MSTIRLIHRLGVFSLLLGFTLSAQELEAQTDGASNQPVFISDLSEVNWLGSNINDSASFLDIKGKCDGGHEKLMKAVAENPNEFPLHELENPAVAETDQHRRWEYQMKRMPVKVVALSDLNDFLSLDIDHGSDTLTFCEDRNLRSSILIVNHSDHSFPSCGITFETSKGVNISGIDALSSKDFHGRLQQPSRREARFYVDSFHPGDSLRITIVYTVDCDGHGRSAAIPEVDETIIQTRFTLEWNGYQLDYDNRTLYKVVNHGLIGQPIVLKSSSKSYH